LAIEIQGDALGWDNGAPLALGFAGLPERFRPDWKCGSGGGWIRAIALA
jgi:hypothetical protein